MRMQACSITGRSQLQGCLNPCNPNAAARLGPRVQAADRADVHVAGDEADAQAARARQVLQPLHERLALLQVRSRVPVVQRVVQLRARRLSQGHAKQALPVQAQRAAVPESRQKRRSESQRKAAVHHGPAHQLRVPKAARHSTSGQMAGLPGRSLTDSTGAHGQGDDALRRGGMLKTYPQTYICHSSGVSGSHHSAVVQG